MRLKAAAAIALGLSALLWSSQANAYLFGGSLGLPGDITLNLNNGATSISQTYSGWYYGDGATSETIFGSPDNTNYIVSLGHDPAGGPVNELSYRDFFVFDLAGLSGLGPITSAQINITPYGITANAIYSVFDFTGNIDELLAETPSAANFADLGNGTLYGSHKFFTTDSFGSPVGFHFDQDFLVDFNAAIARGDSKFAVGGALDGTPTTKVPAPASLGLLGAGLLMLGVLMGTKWNRRS